MADLKRVGALWKKVSKAGNTYLSGNLEINGKKFYVNVFKNDKETAKPSAPDYRILMDGDEYRRLRAEPGGGDPGSAVAPVDDSVNDDLPF